MNSRKHCTDYSSPRVEPLDWNDHPTISLNVIARRGKKQKNAFQGKDWNPLNIAINCQEMWLDCPLRMAWINRVDFRLVLAFEPTSPHWVTPFEGLNTRGSERHVTRSRYFSLSFASPSLLSFSFLSRSFRVSFTFISVERKKCWCNFPNFIYLVLKFTAN